WFINLRTGAKLFIGFGLMIVCLAAVMLTAYRGITGIQESEKKLFEGPHANSVDLAETESNLNRARADVLTLLGLTSKTDQEAVIQDIKASSNHIDELM